MALDPQAELFLQNLAAQQLPAWSEMGAVAARRFFSQMGDIFGAQEYVAAVQDVSVDGQFNLRLYHPSPGESRPVVAYFHGGGWVLGNCNTHDSLCRRLANQSNCAVASVDYRLAPEFPYPQPFRDCFRALQFVAERAAELNVDASRMAVAGDSAGGNLAAAVALKARDARREGLPLGFTIQSQLLIYPVIEPNFQSGSYQEFSDGFGLTRDSMKWFWQQYLGTSLEAADHYAVPAAATDLSDLPRAHVMTAEYDVLRDEGEAYAERLKASAVPTTVTRYDGVLHGFVHFAAVFQRGHEARDDAAAFIAKTLHA